MEERSKKFIPKNRFTANEDKILRKLVKENGEDWNLVANQMGRDPRQCRERWLNYVDPKLTNRDWLQSEDEELLRIYEMYGSKWKTIKGFYPGRSTNQIKNRLRTLQRRRAHMGDISAKPKENILKSREEDHLKQCSKDIQEKSVADGKINIIFDQIFDMRENEWINISSMPLKQQDQA